MQSTERSTHVERSDLGQEHRRYAIPETFVNKEQDVNITQIKHILFSLKTNPIYKYHLGTPTVLGGGHRRSLFKELI